DGYSCKYIETTALTGIAGHKERVCERRERERERERERGRETEEWQGEHESTNHRRQESPLALYYRSLAEIEERESAHQRSEESPLASCYLVLRLCNLMSFLSASTCWHREPR